MIVISDIYIWVVSFQTGVFTLYCAALHWKRKPKQQTNPKPKIRENKPTNSIRLNFSNSSLIPVIFFKLKLVKTFVKL